MKWTKYIFFVIVALLASCKDDELRVNPMVSFKDASIYGYENDGVLKVPLVLSGETSSTSAVYVKIVEGSEVGGRVGSKVSIPVYVWLEVEAVRGFVNIGIVDNDLPNQNYEFDLEITKVSGGVSKGKDKQVCHVTIIDDDVKQDVQIAFKSSTYEVNENDGYADIPVIIYSGLLSGELTFEYTATDGTAVSTGVTPDYTMTSTSSNIKEGETWGSIHVDITDSKAVKADRSFTLNLTSVNGVGSGEVGIAPGMGMCDVTIKQVIRQATFPDTLVLVSETKGSVDFSVSLTAPVDNDVTIQIEPKAGATAVEGVNYTIDSKTFVIPRGETTASTKINIIDDIYGNPNRECEFEITSVSAGVTVLPGSKSVLRIENDDSSIGFVGSDKIALKGQKLTIPIQLDGLHDKNVTLKIGSVVPTGVTEMNDFMIINKDLRILAGDSVVNCEVQLLASSALTDYNFKVTIDEIKAEGLGTIITADPTKQEYSVNVVALTKLDMPTIATVVSANSYSVSEGSSSGAASCLIDGNTGTYWHSAWSGSDIFADPKEGPFLIVLDLGQERAIGQVETIDRGGNRGDTKKVIYEISNDQVTWLPLAETSNSGQAVAAEIRRGRYIRLVITGKLSGDHGLASVAEIYLWGADI